MKKALFAVTSVLWLFSNGCVRTPTGPTAPVPAAPPALEHTFGEIIFDAGSSFVIQYKSIQLSVDLPSTAARKDTLDYLLLTDAANALTQSKNLTSLRRDQKIIAPTAHVNAFSKQGFTQVKGLDAAKKTLLKKDKDFLFVSAIQTLDATTKTPVNGYLLEFDNGRNVLITGGITHMPVLRQQLYDLRDDGKIIHVLVISHADRDHAVLPQILDLYQPAVAAVIPDSATSALKPQTIRGESTESFFQGDLKVVKPSNSLLF